MRDCGNARPYLRVFQLLDGYVFLADFLLAADLGTFGAVGTNSDDMDSLALNVD